MHTEFYQDRSSMWRWRLVANNNKIIADSAEGYVSKSNVMRAWRRVLRALQTGR